MPSVALPPLAEQSTLAAARGLLEPIRLEALPTVVIRGAELYAITEIQCVQVILDELERGRGGSLVTMNLDHLRRFVNEESYAARCRDATVITADGMPLIWASRLQGTPLPERVTGSNLICSLTEAAVKHRKSVFLVGGAPGAAQRTAETLRSRYPGIRIAGVSSGLIDPSAGAQALEILARRLAAAAPDIVYVALGSPKQEELIARLRDTLPHAWWLGVGISFSFVSGALRRAPAWMQRSGLEWMHRLMQEPTRLAHRYLVRGLPFAASLLCTSAIARFRKPELRDPQPADDFPCL